MVQPPPQQQKQRDFWIVFGITAGLLLFIAIALRINADNADTVTITYSTPVSASYSNTNVNQGASSSTQVKFYEGTATPVNGNPWGYDFDSAGGNIIYDPNPDFCNGKYFKCVPGFWDDTRGFVVECADGLYSHKGGVNVGNGGSCPDDGGQARILYWH